jgi:hypothetical protein
MLEDQGTIHFERRDRRRDLASRAIFALTIALLFLPPALIAQTDTAAAKAWDPPIIGPRLEGVEVAVLTTLTSSDYLLAGDLDLVRRNRRDGSISLGLRASVERMSEWSWEGMEHDGSPHTDLSLLSRFTVHGGRVRINAFAGVTRRSGDETLFRYGLEAQALFFYKAIGLMLAYHGTPRAQFDRGSFAFGPVVYLNPH